MDKGYAKLINDRLRAFAEFSPSRYEYAPAPATGVRCWCFENLLPEEVAIRIHAAFPEPRKMRLISGFKERKYTSKTLDELDPLLKEITFAFQEAGVIRGIEQLTGLANQRPDPSLYAGGLSMMGKGNFLNPHIDNSHDAEGRSYRSLNLLYYVTPGWRAEDGGNLELWDKGVLRRVTVPCRFNQLVIMETNPWSWHSVSPVLADAWRCCVSNYYFTPESPIGVPYRHVTTFSARPNQKVRRALAWIDNRAREGVRKIFPRGLGRTDVYTAKRD